MFIKVKITKNHLGYLEFYLICLFNSIMIMSLIVAISSGTKTRCYLIFALCVIEPNFTICHSG